MDIFIQQVVSGIATGGIYGSLALALVMIYQATDVVNFAQGEMAMFSTYVAWSLLQAGLPYWAAFAATLTIAFVGGILVERVVIRPVENAPVLAIVIVCIGLLVIFNTWPAGSTPTSRSRSPARSRSGPCASAISCSGPTTWAPSA